MRNKRLNLALAVTLSSAALIANAAPTYTFTILQSLGGSSKEGVPYSINNSDQIVGISKDASNTSQATLWSNISPSSPTLLQSDGINMVAYRINNSGQIVGTNGFRSFVWNSTSPNSPTELLALGGTGKQSGSYGINNSGQVVGGSQLSNFHYTGALWSPTSPTPYAPAQLQSLGGANRQAEPWAINDTGLVTGWSQVTDNPSSMNGRKATLWDITSPNSPILLESLGGTNKGADTFGINNSGQIIGFSTDANNVDKATLWNSTNPSLPILLESLGGTSKAGNAYGINNSGKIVGWSSDVNNADKATLWDEGKVVDLNDYLDKASKDAGWVLVDASAINDNGSIIGRASNSILGGSYQAFLLQSVAAVPEADTSAMLLMGAGVMGFMARRRKNTQA